MKQKVKEITQKALNKLCEAEDVSVDIMGLPKFDISRTKDAKFGDFATNIALVLSKELKVKPRE